MEVYGALREGMYTFVDAIPLLVSNDVCFHENVLSTLLYLREYSTHFHCVASKFCITDEKHSISVARKA